jgi:hypothetical protein
MEFFRSLLGRNAYLDYGRAVQRAAPQPREAYWES